MKNNIFLIILLIGILIVSGCSTQVEETAKHAPLKTAFQYWPGQYWVEIADEKGFFEEAGLDVELAFNANEDFIGSQKALVNNELNVHQLVLFDFIRFIIEGHDLVAVAATDMSNGGDGIISQEDIQDFAQLKGKKVGVTQNSFLGFILDNALERAGLDFEDIIVVQADAEDIHLFVNKEIDALVTWEPLISNAIQTNNANKLFDTSEIPGLVPDVITFHREFVEKHPETVQAYVNVWHKTTKFITDNPDEAFGIIADIYDERLEDVKGFAQDDKILSLSENKIKFSYAAGFESLHGTARQINDFMIEKGITGKQLDSTEFIDARFIRGVEGQ